jgi:opacity protein-like surface antigen
MKIRHYLLLLLLAGSAASAQKKISLEANYPVPMGGSFFKDNYRGIGDVGFKWAFVSLPVVRIGIGANAGYYDWKGDDVQNPVKIYLIQPKAFAEFSFEPLVSLHPSVGIGYSVMAFKSGEAVNNRSGLNYNVGLAYDIIGGLFVQVQYDAIALKHRDDAENSISVLKAGVGVRF